MFLLNKSLFPNLARLGEQGEQAPATSVSENLQFGHILRDAPPRWSPGRVESSGPPPGQGPVLERRPQVLRVHLMNLVLLDT